MEGYERGRCALGQLSTSAAAFLQRRVEGKFPGVFDFEIFEVPVSVHSQLLRRRAEAGRDVSLGRVKWERSTGLAGLDGAGLGGWRLTQLIEAQRSLSTPLARMACKAHPAISRPFPTPVIHEEAVTE